MKLVAKVATSTTDIELTGISTAAISGDRIPFTAKLNPTKL
jgi:hypothetical protein